MEDANIHTAMEAEKEFVKNPICITAYEQHQKYLRDKKARETFLRKQEEELCKQAEAIGEQRGLAKAALALKSKGMADSEIAELLSMDADYVSKLLAELN